MQTVQKGRMKASTAHPPHLYWHATWSSASSTFLKEHPTTTDTLPWEKQNRWLYTFAMCLQQHKMFKWILEDLSLHQRRSELSPGGTGSSCTAQRAQGALCVQLLQDGEPHWRQPAGGGFVTASLSSSNTCTHQLGSFLQESNCIGRQHMPQHRTSRASWTPEQHAVDTIPLVRLSATRCTKKQDSKT